MSRADFVLSSSLSLTSCVVARPDLRYGLARISRHNSSQSRKERATRETGYLPSRLSSANIRNIRLRSLNFRALGLRSKEIEKHCCLLLAIVSALRATCNRFKEGTIVAALCRKISGCDCWIFLHNDCKKLRNVIACYLRQCPRCV